MMHLTRNDKPGQLAESEARSPDSGKSPERLPETTLKSGYCVIPVSSPEQRSRMAHEVLAGLGSPQKTLPCTYLYDAHGSELYEQITELAEYYPTRTEAAILKQVIPELRRLTETALGEPPEIVELGSGSSAKTRIILDEWQQSGQLLTYMPVDVSETMLAETARTLTRQYNHLNVLGLAGRYEDALNFLPAQRERLFLFLGGSIGNFPLKAQHVFFQSLQDKMGSGSRLLLGYDRMHHDGKPGRLIEEAYNDRSGITAEFNLNILTHINRALGANFDLSQWRHRAIYNETAQQIEMHLESLCPQSVYLKAASREFSFKPGETILTEISRKFDPQEISDWFEALGFQPVKHWQDSAGWYGLLLLQT